MTRAEYEKRLNDLAEEISELRHTVVEDDTPPKPPHPRWKPAPGELFYGNTGSMVWDWSLWDSTDGYKLGCYSWGNAYKTKGEAIFAAECLKTIAEMREWAGNWRDCYALGYDVCESPGHEIIVVEPFYPCGEMRFASKEDAENCVKAVGADRIKKYYLGISEDQDGTQT